MFRPFIDAFAQALPDSLNRLLLDNSRDHPSQWLTLPENVRLVFSPPYGPEVNPVERVWRGLQDELAWRQFAALNAQQAYLGQLLQAYEANTLQALTGYSSLVEATHALWPQRSHIIPNPAPLTGASPAHRT